MLFRSFVFGKVFGTFAFLDRLAGILVNLFVFAGGGLFGQDLRCAGIRVRFSYSVSSSSTSSYTYLLTPAFSSLLGHFFVLVSEHFGVLLFIAGAVAPDSVVYVFTLSSRFVFVFAFLSHVG